MVGRISGRFYDQKLKVSDRVKRVNAQGCYGTVKDVRQETVVTAMSQEKLEKALIVTVLWDNGTQSCFGPEALEEVKE